MTKHTPGPWFLPHFARPGVNCRCGYVLSDDGRMGAIATVHCSGEGEDWQKHGDNPKYAESVANARLIAAAPDLLAALQSLQSFVAVMIGRGPDAEIPDTIPTPLGVPVKIGAIMRDAAAAIAKADGTPLHPATSTREIDDADMSERD